MNEGWFKVHRRVLDSQIFGDPDPFIAKLFLWCLCRANWGTNCWKQGREVLPGQFITGELSAAEQLSVSGSKWRRGMKKLKEIGFLKTEATNRFTVVTIVKWRDYQQIEVSNVAERRATGEQSTSNRRTVDEQSTTEGEEKEKKEHSLTREARIPKSLESPEFRDTWQNYRHWVRSQSGRNPNEIQLQHQLEDLLKRSKSDGVPKVIEDLKLTMRSASKVGTIWDSQRMQGGVSSNGFSTQQDAEKRFGEIKVIS